MNLTEQVQKVSELRDLVTEIQDKIAYLEDELRQQNAPLYTALEKSKEQLANEAAALRVAVIAQFNETGLLMD